MKRVLTLIALATTLTACGSSKPKPTVVQAPAPTPRDTIVRAPVMNAPVDTPIAAETPACSANVTVFFPLDIAQLDVRDQNALTNAAACLRDGTTQVTIEGHADPRGTEGYNLALAERRAKAVKRYLVALGVANERLETVSYGEVYAQGDDRESWQYDRRAALRVQPAPSASR